MSTVSVPPRTKWEFDDNVATTFDDMLRRSIPQYQVMRDTCFSIACSYVQPNTEIVDMGASRGEAIAPLIDRFGAHNHFSLIEISEPMAQICEDRFKGCISSNVVRILRHDLRKGFIPVSASVIQAVLTVQFTPIEYRQRILHEVHRHLLPRGAFVFVEKVLGSCSEVNDLMSALYHQMKADNGYSREDIDRKRLALEGVLVPVTAKWNEELLTTAGFSQIDCFWRWMNFAGWVALK